MRNDCCLRFELNWRDKCELKLIKIDCWNKLKIAEEEWTLNKLSLCGGARRWNCNTSVTLILKAIQNNSKSPSSFPAAWRLTEVRILEPSISREISPRWCIVWICSTCPAVAVLCQGDLQCFECNSCWCCWILLLMLLKAVELIKFVTADVPIVWVVPLSHWRCSRTEIDLKLKNTYHIHSKNHIYLKQAYNVINNLFITCNTLHTRCKQLFRWDPTPSTCPTLTKAEDMGLPTSSVHFRVNKSTRG